MFKENFVNENLDEPVSQWHMISLSKTNDWKSCLHKVDWKLESVFDCEDCSLNVVKNRCVSILLSALLEEGHKNEDE